MGGLEGSQRNCESVKQALLRILKCVRFEVMQRHNQLVQKAFPEVYRHFPTRMVGVWAGKNLVLLWQDFLTNARKIFFLQSLDSIMPNTQARVFARCDWNSPCVDERVSAD